MKKHQVIQVLKSILNDGCSLLLLKERSATELHGCEVVIIEVSACLHHCWGCTSQHSFRLEQTLHLGGTLCAALCEAVEDPIAVWLDGCEVVLFFLQQSLQVFLLNFRLIDLCIGVRDGLLQV